MKKNFLTIACAICFFTLSSFIYSEKENSVKNNNAVTTSLPSSFYYVLDNRFKGGSDEFIALFEKNVSYPKEAFENCRVGLSKIKFTISKEGNFENLELSNPLGFGIDKTITDFFEKIKGEWKAWARSSEMEMTVGFSLVTQKDSYYPDADLLVLEKSAYRWATDNEFCDSDEKINKKVKKYLKKKKFQKALPLVEELTRRHPDNKEYQDQLVLIKGNNN